MIVDGALLVAGGDAPELLEAVDGALNLVALTIDRLIKRAFATHVAFFGDSEADTSTAEQVTHRRATVPLVTDDAPWTQPWASPSGSFDGSCGEQQINELGFVALAGREHERQQASMAVCAQMDLGAEPALAAA
jgi:hypothetical protein